MKSFILDSTYKDSVIVNQNDEFSITPTNILNTNGVNNSTVSLKQLSNKHISHQTQNDKLNKYNFIDCI